MDEMTFVEILGWCLGWLGKIYVSNGFTNTLLLVVLVYLGTMSNSLLSILTRTGLIRDVNHHILKEIELNHNTNKETLAAIQHGYRP